MRTPRGSSGERGVSTPNSQPPTPHLPTSLFSVSRGPAVVSRCPRRRLTTHEDHEAHEVHEDCTQRDTAGASPDTAGPASAGRNVSEGGGGGGRGGWARRPKARRGPALFWGALARLPPAALRAARRFSPLRKGSSRPW